MQEIVKSKIEEGLYNNISTPAYIVHEDLLENNLKKLDYIQSETGIKFMLALKSYSYIPTFDLMSNYLYGVCASGLHEAKLGYNYFCDESQVVETYSPAFKDSEIDDIIKYSDVVVFNSLNQVIKFKDKVMAADKEIGIRINPLTSSHSPIQLFNPVSSTSRMGTRVDEVYTETDGVSIASLILDGTITYLHFHALCEASLTGLTEVLEAIDEKIPTKLLEKITTINIGGGVLYTEESFDVEGCIDLFNWFTEKYPHIELIGEPGEAATYNSGTMIATIVDIHTNGANNIAILDLSAQAHNIDVIQIDGYLVDIIDADIAYEKEYTYILSSTTCLTGDIFGSYSFDKPLKPGDKIYMLNTSFYTKVQMNRFNGVVLPTSYYLDKSGEVLHKNSDSYDKFIEQCY